MGYIEQNLIASEMVVHKTRLHWIIFLWPAILLAIALCSLLAGKGDAAVAFFLIGVSWGFRDFGERLNGPGTGEDVVCASAALFQPGLPFGF